MEQRILVFWLIVYGLIWVLRRSPDNVISRAAFTWIGPLPLAGEMYARFQFRWASYSFGWLCQFALVFSALYVLANNVPTVQEQTWFKVLLFALPLGIGVASLAAIGFIFKACKALWLGPNPTFVPEPGEGNA